MSWIEYEDSGIPKIGFVARPKIKVIIEGVLDIDTQSDITIIPQKFAKTLGLTTGIEAIANEERGYIAQATIIISNKRIHTPVFCAEGEENILGIKVLQEFSKIELSFKEGIINFSL